MRRSYLCCAGRPRWSRQPGRPGAAAHRRGPQAGGHRLAANRSRAPGARQGPGGARPARPGPESLRKAPRCAGCDQRQGAGSRFRARSLRSSSAMADSLERCGGGPSPGCSRLVSDRLPEPTPPPLHLSSREGGAAAVRASRIGRRPVGIGGPRVRVESARRGRENKPPSQAGQEEHRPPAPPPPAASGHSLQRAGPARPGRPGKAGRRLPCIGGSGDGGASGLRGVAERRGGGGGGG